MKSGIKPNAKSSTEVRNLTRILPCVVLIFVALLTLHAGDLLDLDTMPSPTGRQCSGRRLLFRYKYACKRETWNFMSKRVKTLPHQIQALYKLFCPVLFTKEGPSDELLKQFKGTVVSLQKWDEKIGLFTMNQMDCMSGKFQQIVHGFRGGGRYNLKNLWNTGRFNIGNTCKQGIGIYGSIGRNRDTVIEYADGWDSRMGGPCKTFIIAASDMAFTEQIGRSDWVLVKPLSNDRFEFDRKKYCPIIPLMYFMTPESEFLNGFPEFLTPGNPFGELVVLTKGGKAEVLTGSERKKARMRAVRIRDSHQGLAKGARVTVLNINGDDVDVEDSNGSKYKVKKQDLKPLVVNFDKSIFYDVLGFPNTIKPLETYENVNGRKMSEYTSNEILDKNDARSIYLKDLWERKSYHIVPNLPCKPARFGHNTKPKKYRVGCFGNTAMNRKMRQRVTISDVQVKYQDSNYPMIKVTLDHKECAQKKVKKEVIIDFYNYKMHREKNTLKFTPEVNYDTGINPWFRNIYLEFKNKQEAKTLQNFLNKLMPKKETSKKK